MSIPTSTATQVKTKTVSATKFAIAIACLGLAALVAAAVNAEVVYPDKQSVIDQWDVFSKVALAKDKTVQNCGTNWTCFLNAAAKCKKAKATFTYPAIDMGFFGFSIKVTNYNEIKGKLADGTCFMLQKNMKNVFSLSPSAKKEMVKQGASSSDMKKAEAQIKTMNTDKDLQKQMNISSLCAAKSGKILSAELKDWKKGKMEVKSQLGFGDSFSVTEYSKRGVLCVVKQPESADTSINDMGAVVAPTQSQLGSTGSTSKECGTATASVGASSCFDVGLTDCYKVTNVSGENGEFTLNYVGADTLLGYNVFKTIGAHKFVNIGTELQTCTINGVDKTGLDCGKNPYMAKLKVDCED